MHPRRTLALAVTAVAGAVVLVGCDKPDPRITVVSGTTIENLDPVAACRGSDVYKGAGGCHDTGSKGLLIHLIGDTFSVDVPISVAEQRWFISTDRGQSLPTSQSHQRFPFQALVPSVIEVHEIAGPASSRTVWRFRVVSS